MSRFSPHARSVGSAHRVRLVHQLVSIGDADRAELRSGAAVGICPPRPAHTDRQQGRADQYPAALLPA